MLLAAIDIGSNASRLLFANVFQSERRILVEKATLVRIPTRLGEDVYKTGFISPVKEENLIKTLMAYKLLLEVYQPAAYDACATAAMREASNGGEVLEHAIRETGIPIRMINGEEEASIIRRTNKLDLHENNKPVMYIDVGGGSTDISIISDGKILGVKSFKIGTLRHLSGKVSDLEWKSLKKWLKNFSEHFGNMRCIGSGGNINKINKIYGDTERYMLTFKALKRAFKHLDGFTLEERIEKMGLRPDRADVIVPAAAIFIFIMKTIEADLIYVPKTGLADGLVHQLFEHQTKSL